MKRYTRAIRQKGCRPPRNSTRAWTFDPPILEQMLQLEQLTVKGDKAAPRQMYDIAFWSTFWLNSLAKKNPDLFVPIAARQTSWPMLWDPHPDHVKNNKALAESLTLGSRSGINVSQVGKTFSLKVPANQIAIYLVSLAQLAIHYPPSQRRLSQRLVARLDPVRRRRHEARDLEVWVRGEGRNLLRLPPFSRATLNEWKPAVRKLCRFCYGERFDEHPRLQELKQAVIGHAKDSSGKQGPGVVREAMLKKVLQALLSIAPLD